MPEEEKKEKKRACSGVKEDLIECLKNTDCVKIVSYM